MQELIKYARDNFLHYHKISNNQIRIGGLVHHLVRPDEEGRLFTEDFILITEPQSCDFYVFNFGGQWYRTPVGTESKPELEPLRYIGGAKLDLPSVPFLGIHGVYESLSGSGQYKEWVKKAKFLGIKTLGIIEKNTLSGVLGFQQACIKEGIKPILGATYRIKKNTDYSYDVKCYVKNQQGWDNILAINKIIKVDNEGYISEQDFISFSKGLVIIMDPKSLDFSEVFPLELQDVYYQLDTVEYVTDERDMEYLTNLKKYINSDIEPIIITDAYYLEKNQVGVREILSKVSGNYHHRATNQYFKSMYEYFVELEQLFSSTDDRFSTLLLEAESNLQEVVGLCDFTIKLGEKHLPKYIMNEDDKKEYSSNDDMFWGLIEKGLADKKIPDSQIEKYLDRIETEAEVIKYGNLIDYFLINYDEVRFAHSEGILVGHARGSSAGSLIVYLLNITKIDPFNYNLIFERFLTQERAKNSISDIDIDFDQSRRDEIKVYLTKKYGHSQVCSVGTHNTVQIKGAFKDLCSIHSIEFEESNYISKIFEDVDTWNDLMKLAAKNTKIKNFVMEHSGIISDIQLILGAIRSQSVHASAFIISPTDKKIFEWMPVRKEIKDGVEILVSEWEGGELEDVGFLKQDILGVKQLTKIDLILKSIKKEEGVDIDFYNIPLDEKKVYEYFSNGWNEDTFHFGSRGLTGYTKELKPDNLKELIDAMALYRPGAMNSGSHKKYVEIKHGREDLEFIRGWEEITKDTLSILIYQEQVMHIVHQIAGFDPAESDNIRRALGKKKKDLLDSFKIRFVEGGLKNDFTEEDLNYQWEFLENTSSYLFNLSHSTSYSIIGYNSQWLKVNYPIHHWTVAFEKVSQKDKNIKIPNFIAEIHKTGSIQIVSPDINQSGSHFTTDFQKDKIFWSLSSIKQCGEIAMQQIIKDREDGGEYFSFEEFFTRHNFKGSKVNKAVIENLILAGAFDAAESIKYPSERKRLIELYRVNAKTKIKEDNDWFIVNKDQLHEDWWWVLQQKKLSGYAFFDYKKIVNEMFNERGDEFLEPSLFTSESSEVIGEHGVVGGYIQEIIERSSKKGDYAIILLESNYENIKIRLWAEAWEKFREQIFDNEKGLLIVDGDIVDDKYSSSTDYVFNVDHNSECVVLV